ncbi:MAG: fasciclin domain-containing protein [Acetobacteraceae bacterium]
MKTYFPQSSRLAYFLAAITLLVAGMAKQAAAATDVASTLNADPQFSDFVTELKFAGLWPSLEGLQGVTVFAPTNAAFDKTGTAWRADILSEGNFQANGRGTVWQQGLLSAFIQGVHNTNDFAGKTQRVHSLGSTVYWVDGKPARRSACRTGRRCSRKWGK